jgi:tyrosyl-tRNA synthetase
MLLQAFDFSELSRRHEVSVQIGGQDQWGNIITGVDLIHGNGGKAFAVTTPLLTKMDGTKMGKTSNGAVWLNPAMMSSFDFWQFWRNIEDSDVTKLLLAFTELTTEECLRLGSLPGQEINEAKKILATEVTALVHGRAEALNALAVSVANFETNTTSPQGPTLDVHDGMPLVDIMVNIGFAPSKSEARRLIAGGAVKMGLEGIKVVNDKLQMSSVLFDTPALRLEVGKRKVGFLILKGL